ncbi:hypothetical protein CTA2_1307 [Colletotrichum tanaceti]|nr:hypothetical protein CTA2_1307 [Colletotrichum tanaceti]
MRSQEQSHPSSSRAQLYNIKQTRLENTTNCHEGRMRGQAPDAKDYAFLFLFWARSLSVIVVTCDTVMEFQVDEAKTR